MKTAKYRSTPTTSFATAWESRRRLPDHVRQLRKGIALGRGPACSLVAVEDPMYWIAIILLSGGLLLLGLSNPWKFLPTAEGTYLDWTELFWYLQWAGFWLIAASLLAFAGVAWGGRNWPAPIASWRTIPP